MEMNATCSKGFERCSLTSTRLPQVRKVYLPLGHINFEQPITDTAQQK